MIRRLRRVAVLGLALHVAVLGERMAGTWCRMPFAPSAAAMNSSMAMAPDPASDTVSDSASPPVVDVTSDPGMPALAAATGDEPTTDQTRNEQVPCSENGACTAPLVAAAAPFLLSPRPPTPGGVASRIALRPASIAAGPDSPPPKA